MAQTAEPFCSLTVKGRQMYRYAIQNVLYSRDSNYN